MAKHAAPPVGVVVPVFNGGDDLRRCLASLRQTTYPHDLVVVDNHSTDDSVAYVRAHSPATLVTLPKNTGFAGACNRGVAELRRRGAAYVALLNQDATVEPDWLEPLVEYLDAHPEAAAAQALILRHDDPTVINSVGNQIHYLGFGYAVGDGLSIADTRAQRYLRAPREVTYASGAAVLIRVSAVERLGLFQDEFFMYHEDLDFGWRLRLAGLCAVLVPASRVYHRYDFYRSRRVKYEYGERNRLFVLLENYHWLTLLLIFPAWFVMEIGVVTVSILKGWWPEKFRGYRYVVAHLPAILETRRRHQALRRQAERAVVGGFAGDIRYQAYMPLGLRLANPFLRGYWRLVSALIVW